MRPSTHLFIAACFALLTACPSPTASQGPKGDTGAPGPQGEPGPKGDKGDPGVSGMNGSNGTNGADGAQGPKGDTGAQGPKGDTGAQGPQGLQGLQGPAGTVLVLDGGVVTGPAGASVVVTVIAPGGSTCPAGGIRVTQLSDGGISNVCNGAQGPAGDAGPQGPAGPTGNIGPVGPAGVAGPTGPMGTPGSIGPAGPQGPAGPTGSPGNTGPAGPAGPAGPTGPSGPAGAVLYLDGGAVVVPNSTYRFAGFTTATYTGNLGGYIGANAKCSTEYPGSRFCSSADFHLSNAYQSPPDAGAWVEYNRFSTGEHSTSGCNAGLGGGSWTFGTTGAAGALILPTGATSSGSTVTESCAVARPLACCFAPRTASFAGFTTATFTGDLGGYLGAHRKCAAEFPGSWFCASGEFHQANPDVGPATQAWVSYNRFSSGEQSTSGCNAGLGGGSWTYGSTGAAGAVVLSTGVTVSGSTVTESCAVARPLACCK